MVIRMLRCGVLATTSFVDFLQAKRALPRSVPSESSFARHGVENGLARRLNPESRKVMSSISNQKPSIIGLSACEPALMNTDKLDSNFRR